MIHSEYSKPVSGLSPTAAALRHDSVMEGFKKFNGGKTCKLNKNKNKTSENFNFQSAAVRGIEDVDLRLHSDAFLPHTSPGGIAAMRGHSMTDALHLGSPSSPVLQQFESGISHMYGDSLLAAHQLGHDLGIGGVSDTLGSAYSYIRGEGYGHKPVRPKQIPGGYDLSAKYLPVDAYALDSKTGVPIPPPEVQPAGYSRLKPEFCVPDRSMDFSPRHCKRTGGVLPSYLPPHDRPTCRSPYVPPGPPGPRPHPRPRPGHQRMPAARKQYCHDYRPAKNKAHSIDLDDFPRTKMP